MRKQKQRSARTPSQRQLKVGEMLRHTLSTVLLRQEFYDPRLKGVSLTVSEVRASPDLRNATAFIYPLAGSNAEDVLPALQEAEPEIRRAVASNIVLKYMPRFTFKLDKSFEEASRINMLLKQAKGEAQETDLAGAD